MDKCDHISRIKKWSYKLKDGDMIPYASLYDCTNCGKESKKPFPMQEVFIDHSNCSEEPCFGCKAKYLQINTGDVNSRVTMSTRAHDKELGSYYDATRQGIEPISTKTKDIQAAVAISNETGKAFDGADPGASYFN